MNRNGGSFEACVQCLRQRSNKKYNCKFFGHWNHICICWESLQVVLIMWHYPILCNAISSSLKLLPTNVLMPENLCQHGSNLLKFWFACLPVSGEILPIYPQPCPDFTKVYDLKDYDNLLCWSIQWFHSVLTSNNTRTYCKPIQTFLVCLGWSQHKVMYIFCFILIKCHCNYMYLICISYLK
jgi:hypothetical protein